jgi:hypothetical protein
MASLAFFSADFQLAELVPEIILEHALDQYKLSLLSLSLVTLLPLNLVSPLVLRVGGVLKEVPPDARVADFEIVHLGLECGLSADLQNIGNKAVPGSMEFTDVPFSKQANCS